jgi:uncharacterized damage-inducible protein DinB
MRSELDNYLSRIDDLRAQVRAVIADLPVEALNWRPIEASAEHAANSLAVLAAHVAGAEHFWITEVIGSRSATRDRDAEFTTVAADAAGLCQRLDEVAAETHQVFAGLTPSALKGTREIRGRTVDVRWGILHVIEHAALHLGHMQLTYQLWMGGKALASALWFDRLPKD